MFDQVEWIYVISEVFFKYLLQVPKYTYDYVEIDAYDDVVLIEYYFNIENYFMAHQFYLFILLYLDTVINSL